MRLHYYIIAFLLFVYPSLSAPSFAQTPPIRPDAKMTPGATLPVTVADLAVPGYTKKVRNVPQSVKEKVYAEYGITHRAG